MMVTEIHIDKRDFASTRVQTRTRAVLAPGQVRLRIDLFALTANNITYAALGDEARYWEYFPPADASAQWGVLPVWGFASVVESSHPQLPEGERVYGFMPMASEVVLEPTRANAVAFFDGAAHRVRLHPVYNRYAQCGQDPLYAPDTEDVQAVLRPLFITSWLVSDLVEERRGGGACQVLISSASSKTAYGTALQLRVAGDREVVGLTSRGNVAFCEQLGCYDRVVAYDGVEKMDRGTPSIYVDYSGNSEVRMALHSHLRAMRHSLAIGYTHVRHLGPASHLPGPPVEVFSAPDRIRQRTAEWGGAEFSRRLAAAYAGLAEFCVRPRSGGEPLLVIERYAGPAAVTEAYLQVLRGGGDPQVGRVACLGEAMRHVT